MQPVIFLGGTVGNNNWRIQFIENLVALGFNENEIFNPVVEDWNEEAQIREDTAKTESRYMIYYLADPMQGPNAISAYSMVEATMALYDDRERTVVVFDMTGLEGHALKSYRKTASDLKKRFADANIFATPDEALEWFKIKVRVR